jgi:aminoglycoside/choline kinase family phosphotransferase
MILERRAPDADLRSRLEAYLERSGLARRGARLVPLTGDASDRRYYRVNLPDDVPVVLAVHAGPIEFTTLPFVNVAELLARMPVPIPAILGHEDALGILELEDLGDVTLQAHLGAAPAARHAALYRQAVAFVDVFQRRGRELEDAKYLPYGIAFDVPKLTWEMDFFIKHFLEGYRGIVFAARERDALRAELAAIVDELAAEPRVLCHRDYHSRNLMWRDERLCIIDFQDARLGPDTYDLASLLRDSYLDLTEQSVDELIAYFLALQGRSGASELFRRRFDLMALQRNLKALGTFGYQTTGRRNPVYIQYIPRTLKYARETLHRYSRFKRLGEILGRHVDELR